MSIGDVINASQILPPAPRGRTASAPAPDLLDRGEELAVLHRLTERLAGGAGTVVCVEGAGGIGKTALLDAWIAGERPGGLVVARANARVVSGAGPSPVLRRLLDSLLAQRPADGRTPSGALPEVGPARAASVADTLSDTGRHLHELIAATCRTAPMAVVVDNADRADHESLQWLRSLADRLENLPVLLVVGRACQGGHDAATPLDDIVLKPGSVTLELRPFSRISTGRLLLRRYGQGVDDAFCGACHDVSGGNPLLLQELLRALTRSGVRPVAAQTARVAELGEEVRARVLTARLVREPGAALAVSQALAVLGDGESLSAVAALAGVDRCHAEEMVRELQATGVLASGELRFVSAPMRRMVLRAMEPRQRSAAHEHAARLLRDRGEPSERIAHHLMFAPPGGPDWHVSVLEEAAHAAAARGAPGDATGYLREALEKVSEQRARASVLTQLARTELLEDPAAAVHHFREELLLRSDPRPRAEAAGGLATALSMTGRSPEAVTVLQHALAELGTDACHYEWRIRLEAQLVMAAWRDAASVPMGTRLVEARPYREVSGDVPGERAWLAVCALHEQSRGSADVACELAQRALRNGLELDQPIASFLLPLLLVFVNADRPDMATGWFQRMARHAERRGSGVLASAARYGRATAAWHSGSVREGHQHAQRLLDTITERGCDLFAQPPVAAVANLLLDLGSDGLAHDLLNGRAVDGLPNDSWARGAYLLAEGRTLLERRDPHAALAALLECGRHQEAGSLVSPAMLRWRSYAALAYAALGDRTSAVDMATGELEWARRWGTRKAIGIALRTLGKVTDGQHGVRLLSEAIDVLEHSPATVELAYTLSEFGAACQRLAKPEVARESLLRALVLAEECAADCLADRTRNRLRLVGGHVPRSDAAQARRLTRSQRRVAELAAQGRTNREIAQALVVTMRTVETHLTTSYRKLGISGRAELAEALTRITSPDDAALV